MSVKLKSVSSILSCWKKESEKLNGEQQLQQFQLPAWAYICLVNPAHFQWACCEHSEHSKIRFVFLLMTRSHKQHFALTLVNFKDSLVAVLAGSGPGLMATSPLRATLVNEKLVSWFGYSDARADRYLLPRGLREGCRWVSWVAWKDQRETVW